METEQEAPRIHRMDDVLASQVAAGEVVERPASVVKELVENSIDAGARCVRVEVRRGGISLIKVSDDGCGMSRQDALLCLERHATSKLLCYDDLCAVSQLGFRGEALPSIASVAHLRITTRRPQDVEGTMVACDGGEMAPPVSAGCAPGTVIEVSNLFFNTPVRRRFLKGDDTEAAHAEHQTLLHALAFPTIRFILQRDGRTVFDTPATGDLRSRIADLLGRELAASLMRIRPTIGPGVRVSGYLAPPGEAKRTRRLQFVFLNGRPIEDKLVSRAVRDGYGGMPAGVHPALFLYLEVDPGLVDVNVHPAKREVRFRRPGDVVTAVLDAVTATLAGHARGTEEDAPPHSEPQEPPPAPPLVLKPVLQPVQGSLGLPAAKPSAGTASPAPRPTTPPPAVLPPTPAPTAEPAASSPTRAGETPAPLPPPPGFSFLGPVGGEFALFEGREGLVFLNPQAARERILFEQLMRCRKQSPAVQDLLLPLLLELDPRELPTAREMLPTLSQAGFRLSFFGRTTLRIESLPALLSAADAKALLTDLIHSAARGELRTNRGIHPFEPYARRLAQRTASRETPDLTPSAALSLLAALLRCEIPYCTPSGKPTLVPLTSTELQRKFRLC